jgi:predicted RNA methylase
MSIHTSPIYRILIPKFIRKRILAKQLRASILSYYANLPEVPSEELAVVLDYLKTNPIEVFPYHFQNQYIADKIEVLDDPEKGLRYVMLDGKKLYFKKRWSKQRIQHSFNELTKEQDLQSPHRYLNENFKIDEGEVLVDIGVAEGNFALGAVEKASRLILFETDKEWIEALNATFEPWKDKVLIVNKFVSDITNATNTTLDDFIGVDEKVTFLKIDVDGAESRLLKGSQRILSEQKPLKVAVCTYHKQNDEKDFTELLSQNGFQTSHSDGFMLFYYDKKMQAPYLRRGLIRAIK